MLHLNLYTSLYFQAKICKTKIAINRLLEEVLISYATHISQVD